MFLHHQRVPNPPGSVFSGNSSAQEVWGKLEWLGRVPGVGLGPGKKIWEFGKGLERWKLPLPRLGDVSRSENWEYLVLPSPEIRQHPEGAEPGLGALGCLPSFPGLGGEAGSAPERLCRR